MGFAFHGAGIPLTAGLNISRIDPAGEPDPSTIFRSYGASAEIGQKGAFCKSLVSSIPTVSQSKIFLTFFMEVYLFSFKLYLNLLDM